MAARRHQARIDELWDYADPAASEGRFRAAADAADGAVGAERHVYLTQVARAVGLQGRYDEATETLSAIKSRDVEVRVRLLLERGRVLNTSGSPDKARPRFASAFSLASAVGLEHLAIDALHMVAIVAPADEQAALNEKALALASAADDPRARNWRASLLNNLGWTRFDAGDYPAALALFEEAVAERERMGSAPETLIARWCVGRTMRALGRVDEALAIQLDLAHALVAAGTSDSYVDEEIAACRAELAERHSKTTPDPGSG